MTPTGRTADRAVVVSGGVTTPQGFRQVAFDDLDALAAVMDSRVAAVLLEPVQGEGGVRPLTQAFADAINQACAKTGALLIADEVQSGLGRTGLMLFAEFDLGDILRRETGSNTPKIIRFLVGNPIIMKEMVKHVPDAGSYAPVTVLLDERPDDIFSRWK